MRRGWLPDVSGSAGDAPGWLLPVVIAVGAVATVVAAAGVLAPGLGWIGRESGGGAAGGSGAGGGDGGGGGGGPGRQAVAAMIGAGLVAALLVPAAAEGRHPG
jgi:hypothetical protein